MNPELAAKLLPSIIKAKGSARISVTGFSMEPTLYEGDSILIQTCDSYEPGDILVYTYKDEGLLVHRLLKKDTRYYCKGDNAFRLEDITHDSIIGKVISVNDTPMTPWPAWKLRLSFAVSRQLLRNHYDVATTRKTNTYRLYNALILKKGDFLMTYQTNKQMDFIPSDQTSLAVFDPVSGNTWFFDETGIDILNALDDPCDLDTLLNRLCQIYETSPQDIRADVEEFLADTVSKKVVVIS